MENKNDLDLLTQFALEASRTGPKTDLSDAQLHERRYQLNRFFEQHWGEIGYRLQKCRSVKDISDLFGRLLTKPPESTIRYIIESVARQTGDSPDGARLRGLKIGLRQVVERRYKAFATLEEAQRLLQRIMWALNAARKDQFRRLKRKRKEQRKQYAAAKQSYENARHNEEALTQAIRRQQPSFALHELLKFLGSRKYELKPANLGSAMAGFPDIGCRQSIFRCRRFQPSIDEGEIYQIFKAVRYLVQKAPDKLSKRNLTTYFESNIRVLPSRYKSAQQKLAQHWIYVENAIRQLPKTPLHPREIPFKVMENYVNQFKTYSQVDAILAEQSRIVLPKRQPRKTT